MTQTMLHIEGARTRMPLVCTVISLLVLAVFVTLSFLSWVIETNATVPEVQVPQTNTSATNVSVAQPPDPYETDSWVRHGREF
ncbi:MAG TPA: hypothetical protein PK156_03085 [Polyangium sp.]|nr:hypothetical protein [Polyangium sp.]